MAEISIPQTREEAYARLTYLDQQVKLAQERIDALQTEARTIRAHHKIGHVTLVGLTNPGERLSTRNEPLLRESFNWRATAKIETIKCLRQHLNLGLKEAKDLVESLPQPLPVDMEHPLVRDLLGMGADVRLDGMDP